MYVDINWLACFVFSWCILLIVSVQVYSCVCVCVCIRVCVQCWWGRTQSVPHLSISPWGRSLRLHTHTHTHTHKSLLCSLSTSTRTYTYIHRNMWCIHAFRADDKHTAKDKLNIFYICTFDRCRHIKEACVYIQLVQIYKER